jgi:hypothetical protein
MSFFKRRRDQSAERAIQQDYFRSIRGLELRVEALLGSLKEYEEKAPLTPPLRNLAKGLENALRDYRSAKANLENSKV